MHINFLSLLLVADALEELLRLLLIHFKRYFVQSAFEHACLHFYECVFVCVLHAYNVHHAKQTTSGEVLLMLHSIK